MPTVCAGLSFIWEYDITYPRPIAHLEATLHIPES
jgi:hypothetical protein